MGFYVDPSKTARDLAHAGSMLGVTEEEVLAARQRGRQVQPRPVTNADHLRAIQEGREAGVPAGRPISDAELNAARYRTQEDFNAMHRRIQAEAADRTISDARRERMAEDERVRSRFR